VIAGGLLNQPATHNANSLNKKILNKKSLTGCGGTSESVGLSPFCFSHQLFYRRQQTAVIVGDGVAGCIGVRLPITGSPN
jgi:hypothetical protein